MLLDLDLKLTIYTPKQIKCFNEKMVAILGRSNVGKSSFINSISLNKKIARISKTAGKTVSINFYWSKKHGFSLIDFPGYGYAKLSHIKREELRILCENFLQKQESLKALVLIDSRIGLLESDFQIISYLDSLFIPYTIILTKIDKLKSNNQKKTMYDKLNHQLEKVTQLVNVIPHSSFKNIGVKRVISEIISINKKG